MPAYERPREHRCKPEPRLPSLASVDTMWECECGRWWRCVFSSWREPDVHWRRIWPAWWARAMVRDLRLKASVHESTRVTE